MFSQLLITSCFQATFYGTNVSNESFQTENLICFARKKDDGKSLLSVSAGRIRNNSIVCDEMVVRNAGTVSLGVAASVKAAERGYVPRVEVILL